MKKQGLILACLLALLGALFLKNFSGSPEKRVSALTYETGKTPASMEKAAGGDGPKLPRVDAKGFPPVRAPFRMGHQNIFQPLRFEAVRTAPAPVVAAAPPLALPKTDLLIFVGEEAEMVVENAKGNLSVSFKPEMIATVRGERSPLIFSCRATGRVTATISDGSGAVLLNLDCDLRPPEKKLAGFIFLGFLKSEKEKTIFLSKDKEVILVKKGDTILKKSGSISDDYVVKVITDDKIAISSLDGSDIMEISLVENEPLLRSR